MEIRRFRKCVGQGRKREGTSSVLIEGDRP
jgi:hypothetical protein